MLWHYSFDEHFILEKLKSWMVVTMEFELFATVLKKIVSSPSSHGLRSVTLVSPAFISSLSVSFVIAVKLSFNSEFTKLL